ncbi:DNA helicase, partial [Tanacetum coccineum]
VHRVNVSRNVKRRLLTSHISMPTNASMFMGIAKQQVGPAYTVENYGNKDRNCVPISRVFDCFKSIRTANIGADHMAQTGEHNFGPTYTIENRVDEDRNCIPISKVFNRFMSMHTANIQADCMAQPAIRKRSLSTTGLPYASMDSRLTPNVVTATVDISRNVRRCLTGTSLTQCPMPRCDILLHPGFSIPHNSVFQSPLTTLNHAYLYLDLKAIVIKSVIITFSPTSLNIECANANINGPSINNQHLILDSALNKDISRNIDCRIPFTTLNHAYLCLDIEDGVIRHATISFPNIVRATSRQNHIFAEYSRDNTKFVHNEVFYTNENSAANAWKRKNAHPLLIARPEDASPSRNIKRHFIPTPFQITRATADRDDPIVNSQSLNSNSPHTRDDIALYMDLDEHNGLVRLFRTARDRCNMGEIPGLKIRLYNMGGVRRYELPTSDLLGGIIFENGPKIITDFDVIIEFRDSPSQRINKLHQAYMSLQFPLLFVFGQPGFHLELQLKPRDGRGKGKVVTMNAYYKYRLHPRAKEFGLLFKSGRLGDREGIAAGSKIMLPSTFTRGPRVFEQKVKDFVKFLKEVKMFGYVSAEIPDPVQDPKGYKLVTDLMMYGPCGAVNSDAYHTQYQRRDTEVHVMKGESKLDNCNVSRTSCAILNVHLENMQRVNFRKRDRLDIIVNILGKKKTILIEWFVYNNENTDGRHLTYLNFPSEFVWYPNSKQWQQRQIRMKKSLGRLTYIHPSSCDLFYFRMLLCHQKGCRSPIEVQTINGQTIPTYQAACEALDFGLELHPEHLLKDLENKLLMEEKNYKRDLLREDAAQSGLTNEEQQRLETFAKWLLDVGNDEIGEPNEENDQDSSWITILLGYSIIPDETGMSQLIDFIYDDTTLKTPTTGALQQKAIVCSKNQTSDAVNVRIFANVEGQSRIYLSNDEAIPTGRETSKTNLLYPTEYLNTITFPGFPPHELELKVGSPIMLLRNVNLSEGLCNGTRMIIRFLMSRRSRKMSTTTIASLEIGQENCILEARLGNILEFTMWGEVAKQVNKEEIEKLTPPVFNAVSSCRVTKYKVVVGLLHEVLQLLGRAPNHCSSSIGKTRGVVIVHSRNRLGRLDHGLTEF